MSSNSKRSNSKEASNSDRKNYHSKVRHVSMRFPWVQMDWDWIWIFSRKIVNMEGLTSQRLKESLSPVFSQFQFNRDKPVQLALISLGWLEYLIMKGMRLVQCPVRLTFSRHRRDSHCWEECLMLHRDQGRSRFLSHQLMSGFMPHRNRDLRRRL